jgi:hypothetical protein
MNVEPTPYFTAEAFTHAAEAKMLTCPGGVSTQRRTRNRVNTGWKYTFPRDRCASCPLQANNRRNLDAPTSAESSFIEYYNYIRSKLSVKIVSQRCQPVFRDFPEQRQRLVDFGQKLCDGAVSSWPRWIATRLHFVHRTFGPICAVFQIVFRFERMFSILIQALLFELHMQQCSQKHARKIILDTPMTVCDDFQTFHRVLEKTKCQFNGTHEMRNELSSRWR